MTTLLVTNDFPPKVGGIQSYLWELWRRLPPGEAVVLTTAFPGADAFDRVQGLRVARVPGRVLLPTPATARRVLALADEVGAAAVVVDPVLPLGLLGPRLGRPYAVVAHGAEVAVPGRLPVTRLLVAGVVRRAAHVVAGGAYVHAVLRDLVGDEMPATTLVPPGVDLVRFRPLDDHGRAAARSELGLPARDPLVVSVSRLVPRKGMDVLVEAVARLAPAHPGLTLAIAGDGRDRPRLERLVARTRAPVRLLGPVPDELLPRLHGCADVFALPCRDRWAGLEQEGFGIVFLEAAACGVAQVAGASGGAGEAVADGVTGLVVDRPADPAAVADALGRLLQDPGLRARLGRAARRRAERDFCYDALAARLAAALRRLAA